MSNPMTGRASEIERVGQLLATGQSVLLVGAAGVGKSRLAAVVGASLDTAAWHVETINGSPALARIPFGCVASLLPPEPAADRLTLLKQAETELLGRANGRSVLVIADDLDRVDAGTAALIEALPAAGVAVLATLRTSGLDAPSVAMAWKDERLLRVDIGALPENEAAALAATILATVDTNADPAPIVSELWRLSEGNPLFIRELLLGGMHDEQIVVSNGQWSIAGALGQNQRVRDVIERRLDHLDADQRGALVRLAVTEPLPSRVVGSVVDDATLHVLESASMVSRVGDPAVFTTSHPLIGEVVRSSAGPAISSAAQVAVAAALLGAPGPATSVELLRAATWQLEAGDISADVALEAAGAALGSFESALALRLATASAEQESASAAHLIVGKAAALEGEFAVSETALRLARDVATTDVSIATAAAELATTTGLMGRRPDDARAELAPVFEQLTDPEARVVAGMALLLMNTMCGDISAVEVVGSELLELAMAPPVEVQALIFVTLAQAIGSRLDGVDERIDRGLELANRFAEALPVARLQLLFNRLFAWSADGRLVESLQHVSAERDAMRAGGGPADVLSGGIGQLQSLHGGYTVGIEAGMESLEFAKHFDPFDLGPMIEGLLGVLEAQTGQVGSAAGRIGELLVDPLVLAQPRMTVWLRRAKAWTLYEGGDPNAARVAAEAGRQSFAAGEVTWGAMAMHDALQFGGAALVAADLAEASQGLSARMLVLINNHAQGAVEKSVDSCSAAALGFEAVQAWPMAAAAWVDVARLAADEITQARAAVRAETIWRAIPNFDTRTRRELVVPLTDREFEIAAAACTGSSSKDIAESSFLSTRTVDNHLQRVYRKLDIGRSELPELFTAPRLFPEV